MDGVMDDEVQIVNWPIGEGGVPVMSEEEMEQQRQRLLSMQVEKSLSGARWRFLMEEVSTVNGSLATHTSVATPTGHSSVDDLVCVGCRDLPLDP